MLAGCRLTLVNGELSLFRNVDLIRTPGQTGGHCSLLLRDGETRVALAQDALKHRGEATSGRATQAFDTDMAANSIERLLREADIIVPGHDAALTVEGGSVSVHENPREEIAISLDGRTISIEI
jgi:glyoxylase-like metal-dependent hydrolase (beta-lactamase superfamily II)